MKQNLLPKSILDCCSGFKIDETTELIPDDELLLRSFDASNIILKLFPSGNSSISLISFS